MPMQEIVDFLYNELALTEELSKDFIKVALSDMITFDKKQSDYGSHNIATFGEKGVIVRLSDKMARAINLVWGNKEPANEKIEDTYQDLSVYGVIIRMCRRGLWPGV